MIADRRETTVLNWLLGDTDRLPSKKALAWFATQILGVGAITGVGTATLERLVKGGWTKLLRSTRLFRKVDNALAYWASRCYRRRAKRCRFPLTLFRLYFALLKTNPARSTHSRFIDRQLQYGQNQPLQYRYEWDLWEFLDDLFTDEFYRTHHIDEHVMGILNYFRDRVLAGAPGNPPNGHVFSRSYILMNCVGNGETMERCWNGFEKRGVWYSGAKDLERWVY
jgi:hypothetical protein